MSPGKVIKTNWSKWKARLLRIVYTTFYIAFYRVKLSTRRIVTAVAIHIQVFRHSSRSRQSFIRTYRHSKPNLPLRQCRHYHRCFILGSKIHRNPILRSKRPCYVIGLMFWFPLLQGCWCIYKRMEECWRIRWRRMSRVWLLIRLALSYLLVRLHKYHTYLCVYMVWNSMDGLMNKILCTWYFSFVEIMHWCMSSLITIHFSHSISRSLFYTGYMQVMSLKWWKNTCQRYVKDF